MMTIDERAAYQRYCEKIQQLAKDITPKLPYGVRADLGWNSDRIRQRPHLVIRIFSDLIEGHEGMHHALEAVVAEGIKDDDFGIVVTTIAEMRIAIGDGVHGELWNYGDPIEYRPLKKKRK